VAEKDGIITSIVTRQGMPQVVQGDVVKKGDVLVSGDLLIKMEEVLKDVEFTHSDADIYAKTLYEYEDALALEYQEKVYTGKKKKAYAFSLFNQKVTFFHPKIKYDNYDRIEKNQTLKIGTDFFLPFENISIQYNEYYFEQKQYTKEEAEEILQFNLNKFIKELEEKGVQILENNVKIIEENNSFIAEGHIIVIEKIGKDEIINTSEQRLKYEDDIIRENDADSQ
jgi:similar to stage IV sporulation protein